MTAKAAHILEGMLMRGFTTVRDAGEYDQMPTNGCDGILVLCIILEYARVIG